MHSTQFAEGYFPLISNICFNKVFMMTGVKLTIGKILLKDIYWYQSTNIRFINSHLFIHSHEGGLTTYLAILPLLVHASYYLLSNQNQSVYLFLFHIPTKFMTDTQRKKHFLVVICVCSIISCSEIFLSPDGIFQHSINCTKKNFVVTNHGGYLS